MKSHFALATSFSVLAMLAACGGGGGSAGTGKASVASTSTATADKYVGTWSACFAEAVGSTRETLVITRLGDSSISYTATALGYEGANCSGATTGTGSEMGSVVFSGTKFIGADVVDKGIVTSGTAVSKQVFLVKGTSPVTLTTGRQASDGGSVDSDGYPTTLDSTPLIKQ